MELFKHSIILTKRFERYGGDSQNTLALIVNDKGVAFLYHSEEHVMKSITTYAPYVYWLIHNSMDLLTLAEDTHYNNVYCDWWSEDGDRNDYTQRREEFRTILKSF